MKYDFSGYATKNDLKCSDGRVIRRDAFKENHGTVVPLVYQHNHNEIDAVLGHALLENREDGVYAYGSFNDSEAAQQAKILVKHGDINSLSIFANKLVQNGPNVMHGIIREVSLVLAGANPGAHIENLCFEHSDGFSEKVVDEATIYSGEMLNVIGGDIEHSNTEPTPEEDNQLSHEDDGEEKEEGEEMDEETIGDIIDTMTDKQKDILYYLVGEVSGEDGEEGESVKHSVFDMEEEETYTLSHAEMAATIDRAKHSASGSLKAAMEETFLEHGINQVDILFPEAKLVTPTPEMIARPNSWVTQLWGALKKAPFARIKSTAANITEDEARARGYIKGKQKKEEVIKLLKRSTTPQTVYKLQKMDRDDVIDITDFDVIAWLKAEMRMMLDEELARAVLIGDGRDDSSDDKIKEEHIRPIWTDNDVYVIHETVSWKDDADETFISNLLVDKALRARKNYKGSGNPLMYASNDVINNMLLAKDKIGRRLYATIDELANALRVSGIIEVPVMDGVSRTVDNVKHELLFIIVNPGDYTVGADKGGAVNMFDDFDLNFNKYEYLIETRCSGALTKPYSAIVMEKVPITTVTTPPTQGGQGTDVQG